MTHVRLPADKDRQALTLIEACRNELQDLLGRPLRHFGTVDVRQSDAGPTIAFDRDNAVVLVGPHATLYEPALIANVAHESVHLHLTDGEYGNANGLEEGFAVHFELSTVETHYGANERQHHVDHLSDNYANALSDYEKLLSMSDAPAKCVRDAYGKLTGVSSRELRRLFTTLGWWMSHRLARRKRMRPG
ncbi:hypothetical protein SH528x_003429 [Novipirellula sp. SH528]|uniref:hypothetical protein n=1 Tax=Novipirellula sp. SH528 TaxID=3454466 RepID=UPI003FA0EC09